MKMKSSLVGAGHIKRIFARVIVVCLCGGVPVVQAFEGDEHKLLGDTAVLALQAQYHCEDKAATDAEICKLLQQIDGSHSEVPSYGDIVACVDFFLTPEKMMAGFDESAQHLIATWPKQRCDGGSARLFQASHSNHTHFQQELLVSLHTYHQLALSIARDPHKLPGALLMNAIGDHYLQDFFAPGHITVKRDRLSDLFANAMHDAANDHGATFHMALAKGLPQLRDKMAVVLQATQDSHAPDRAGKIRTYLQGGQECLRAEDVLAAGSIELKGDGQLRRGDGCRQRLLMLAANMLSLEDVLLAGRGGSPQAYYQEYDFYYRDAKDWSVLKPFSYLPSIHAELPFGFYALGNNPRVGDNTHDRMLPLDRYYVFGLTVGKELFSNGSGVARTAGTLEFVPFGAVSPGVFGNYGLALGVYGYGGAGDVSGAGLSARLGFIIPESESTFSLGVRRVNHSGSEINEWGTGWYLRYDQGYSSFMSLYLSAGRDWAADTPNALTYGAYLSAGIMIAAPTSRISVKSFKSFLKGE